MGLMGEQFVAVDVERCGFDVVVQGFEFALIDLFGVWLPRGSCLYWLDY